jgi:F-type H+-transporting ATPase subunit c
MRKLSTLLVPLTILAAAFIPTLAFGADPGHISAEAQGMVALGAGVAIGFGALGTGIGQGLAALGALQGIARNPSAAGKITTQMIICLALIESLCIYALVIAFFLQGKLPG